MSYKTILVHGGADAAAEARLKAALAVGRLFGAALTIAGAEAWWPYPGLAESALYSPDLIQAERDALERRLGEARTACGRQCEAYEQAHVWREAIAFPDLYLVELAQGADLVIASRPEKGRTDAVAAKPSTLVMQAGAPVLLLPSGRENFACETVVVAWKDTHEARRALADSLPLLKLAQKVVLLQVAPADAVAPRSHDVLERLRRHGVMVTPDFRASSNLGDGGDLLAAARSHHADLIVAGAYGHSRLREWVFGGVTQTLLESSPLPVLFSR
jgi:nucleotide-binding universal stress UspA family protein